jgi:hypothetical protein
MIYKASCAMIITILFYSGNTGNLIDDAKEENEEENNGKQNAIC